ncbi:hypothetical protein SLA2020_446380 [Shorea laevis]
MDRVLRTAFQTPHRKHICIAALSHSHDTSPKYPSHKATITRLFAPSMHHHCRHVSISPLVVHSLPVSSLFHFTGVVTASPMCRYCCRQLSGATTPPYPQ